MLSLIFWHQYHVMWYFLVIFNTKIIKSTKIMITVITHTIVVIIVTLRDAPFRISFLKLWSLSIWQLFLFYQQCSLEVSKNQHQIRTFCEIFSLTVSAALPLTSYIKMVEVFFINCLLQWQWYTLWYIRARCGSYLIFSSRSPKFCSTHTWITWGSFKNFRN